MELPMRFPALALLVLSLSLAASSVFAGDLKESDDGFQHRGPSLRVGALVPITDGYADSEPGILLELGYWAEFADVVVEPRVGIRFDVQPEHGNYVELPFDLGLQYLMTQSDFAPFVGGGIGAHWFYEYLREDIVLGEVIQSTSVYEESDHQWGFVAFGRAGLAFFRTRAVRLVLSAEFSAAFAELNDRSNPYSMNFGIAFVL